MNIEQERTTRQTSEHLFDALVRRDVRRLGALYLPDATFADPVLGELPRGAVTSMWSAFLAHVDSFELTVVERSVSVHVADVRWRADYRVSATGRRVSLDLATRLVCLGPRISRHEDRYDSWAWARMVHGMPGLILGWSPLWLRRQPHPAHGVGGSVTRRNTTTPHRHSEGSGAD